MPSGPRSLINMVGEWWLQHERLGAICWWGDSGLREPGDSIYQAAGLEMWVAIKRKKRKEKEGNLNTDVINPQRGQAAACPAFTAAGGEEEAKQRRLKLIES